MQFKLLEILYLERSKRFSKASLVYSHSVIKLKMRLIIALYFCVALLLCLARADDKKPNIILFFTDDQDQMLGASFPSHNGVTPMRKTQRDLVEKGLTTTNFFIHTPICCPSRAELVTGRYFHNLKTVQGGAPDTVCMHINETKVKNHTFAKVLKEQGGYEVGLFGKYLNNWDDEVPPGFDVWLANGGGDYIAPEFATKNLQFAGLDDGKWQGTVDNYTTATVGNISLAWIERQANQDKPFFAYIAPKAVHEPFIPAPWYIDHWDESWPATEPRDMPVWNMSFEGRADHHGNIKTNPLLTEQAAKVIADTFKNRWRTIMSVDDLIADVIAKCEDLDIIDNTYFFFTSDHGFQLGQFNMLMDKRQVYDWNTRIPLVVRGPNIAAGSTLHAPATQVDLAPTFLDIAGILKPSDMDGHSLLPLLAVDDKVNVPWRDSVFIEYYFNGANIKCVENCSHVHGNYPKEDAECGDLPNNADCYICQDDCYPTEDPDNNFIALRHVDPSTEFGNTLYAEFASGDHIDLNFKNLSFNEYYNIETDKWQTTNLYKTAQPKTIQALHNKLHAWYNCAGDACP